MYGAANYGREVLLNVPSYPTGGMAAPDVNPRGGVFGPQGYGGGIFDGSMHGLGQLTTSAVRDWQALLNVELRDRGYGVVPITGVIDKDTCGATLMLTNAYVAGEGVYSALADALDAGQGLAVAGQCAAVQTPWPEPKKRVGTMQILMYGGAGALVFVAAMMIVKRKR
jgi:hypothetical protein